MHTLYEYVAKQLADKIKERGVVVWYDERREFQPFVDEVRGSARTTSQPVSITVGGTKASLAEYAGSMFELRAVVEPHVSGDKSEAVVVYLPGVAHDANGSVLMELEKAGRFWKPELGQLARNVLLQKFTLGVVDDMLKAEHKLTYADLARAADGNAGTEPPSVLKGIFHGVSGNDGLLIAWLISDARDAEIVDKQATSELTKLVKVRTGLDLDASAPLTKLRAITLRYVLAGEFRQDLRCEPPASLDAVRTPSSKEADAVHEIALRLRTSHAAEYEAIADRVEAELGLKNAQLPPGSLGAIDTFRFEERALLRHAGELIANGQFDAALSLVAERERSFWLDRDVARKAQWEATRRMAELGNVALAVRAAVSKMTGNAAAWFNAYVAQDGSGWFRLDQAQRRLEAWLPNLEEEPEERPLGVVRRAYEDAVHAMAEGFTKALDKAGWTVAGALYQTRVWSEVVANRPKPVAYFLVDAMRFEMGVELAERLPKTTEVSVRAAVSALPSITPIGMAALMPGASASFSVVEESEKLGARIDDSFLSDLPSRQRFAAARVPNLVDIELDDLLERQNSKLKKKLEDAQVVIVRSGDIDKAGEAGMRQARKIMDSVINDLSRAIRKLAGLGIEHAVVSADHGHLFGEYRDESMRIQKPGGDEVDLHRRCWVGRGGATPAGCIRVPASSLGYNSDLDFIFPSASGVFKAGGDLAFHHGGPSLQELVIPVLSIRTKTTESEKPKTSPITATGLPAAVTNRIFSVTLTFAERQMTLGATGLQVRPLLMSGGKQVGGVGMAVDAQFDRDTGCVTVEPNKAVTIAFLLSDESAVSLRVVVQDPTSDAELYRSPTDIPVRLGV